MRAPLRRSRAGSATTRPSTTPVGRRTSGGALLALESLHPAAGAPPCAVVLTADRGRGKSSALGLAAAGLQRQGVTVAVTGPGDEACAEVLRRAAERGGPAPPYVPPAEVTPATADVLLVDEAAALSVASLRSLAEAIPRLGFATTVHGYEGTGQGFAVRFRGHLAARGGTFREVTLDEPIRWSPGDPLEAWARDAFLLDAEPVPRREVDRIAANATPIEVERVGQDALARDERPLRELFGLLVHAHYRTSPEDLVHMLDGPNVHVVIARAGDHAVGAALLAREGGLPDEVCDALLAGRRRVRGNMLPETLTCHLAESESGRLRALRVLRLAVHPALQRRGIGRRLLDAAAEQAAAEGVDYLGAGFAATPALLRFWACCGFGPVRLAVTRSRVSGEHSAVVIKALSARAEPMELRLLRAFLRRFPHVLADALRGLEPEVAATSLAAAGAALAGRGHALPGPALTDDDWRALHACAFGPVLYDALVQPAWEVVRTYLADPGATVALSSDDEALLVRKVLQHRRWQDVAQAPGRWGRHEAMRRLRAALQPLVRAYRPAGGSATESPAPYGGGLDGE